MPHRGSNIQILNLRAENGPGTVSGRTILPLESIVSFMVCLLLMVSYDLTMLRVN